VSDDGVGVPRELELGRTNTLGFQLIPLLAEQTGGKLQLLRGEGTRYELVLTETETETEQNN
jgi:two-component sensor histidine kinase